MATQASTQDVRCDVLVVGSGAGGLVAALAARAAGLDTLLIEKASLFGGTTSHSEGMIWVPMSPHARAQGVVDSADDAFTYLAAVAGNYLDHDKALAYLRTAPEMVAFVEGASRVRYALAASLDYASDAPGATAYARSLRVAPMNGRKLGDIFDQIRPPLRTTLAFGGMTVTGADFAHVLNAHRSLRSLARMTWLTALYGWDRARGYSRGTRISHGHAVVAGLVEALTRGGAALLRQTTLLELTRDGDRVDGALARAPRGVIRIHARRGVVLATGGFSANASLQAAFFDHVRRGHGHALLASETATGDGLAAAQAIGGALATTLAQPAAWTPASLVPQRDGPAIAYPHYLDRTKPGFIAVLANGKRFTNESATYHHFAAAMMAACSDRPATEAWLIADSRAVDRFGMGAAPPFPPLLRAAVRAGYLARATTLDGLAAAIGAPGEALAATVARFNAFARAGRDEDFSRGGTDYERANGDPKQTPNPSLGALERPPFYAVKLVPSDIGTFAGLRTDAFARVLDVERRVIPGLYAVGNDAASAFGGTYPAAGITVGLAMTFGYVAGRHLASASAENGAPSESVTPDT